MESEFQEADVVWAPEEHQLKRRAVTSNNLPSCRGRKISDVGFDKVREKSSGTSAPICIPSGDVGGRSSLKMDIGDGGAGSSSVVVPVPPHIMVSRRCDEKMAYSLCFGNGRTLKGRDLSRVRNSVLRLTGFIEG